MPQQKKSPGRKKRWNWTCTAACKEAKRLPYGAKGWDFCGQDSCMIPVVNNKVPRQKAKAEIRAERKRLGK